jgi:hypothetical protein
MDSAIIVGIFTLAGVAVGAGLNYITGERSRRRERMDLTQEEMMDTLGKLDYTLGDISVDVEQLGKAPTAEKENYYFGDLIGNLPALHDTLGAFYTAQFKIKRYVKSKPIITSFQKIMDELGLLLNKFDEFRDEYSKSKSVQSCQELQSQIERTLKAINEASVVLSDSG